MYKVNKKKKKKKKKREKKKKKKKRKKKERKKKKCVHKLISAHLRLKKIMQVCVFHGLFVF